MRPRLTRTPYDPQFGIFYDLWCPGVGSEYEVRKLPEGTLIGGDPDDKNQFPKGLFFGRVSGILPVEVRECPVDRMHVTGKWFTDPSYGAVRWGTSAMFFPMQDQPLLVIRSDLARTIRASGCLGPRLTPIGHHWDGARSEPLTEDLVEWYRGNCPGEFRLFLLEGTGPDLRQTPRFDPPEADKCPFCGFTPLVCRGCGHISDPCPRCNKFWNLDRRMDPRTADPRLVDTFGEPEVPHFIVDPRKWTGEDLCGRREHVYATRRFVDFLLAIHASPFIAVPVPVNMHGVDKALREKLEAAKRPLRVPS